MQFLFCPLFELDIFVGHLYFKSFTEIVGLFLHNSLELSGHVLLKVTEAVPNVVLNFLYHVDSLLVVLLNLVDSIEAYLVRPGFHCLRIVAEVINKPDDLVESVYKRVGCVHHGPCDILPISGVDLSQVHGKSPKNAQVRCVLKPGKLIFNLSNDAFADCLLNFVYPAL